MEVQRDMVGKENSGERAGERQRAGRGTGDGAGQGQRDMKLEERHPTPLT